MGKIRMSITLDEEVAKVVQTLAREDSRNTSQMINKILRDTLIRPGASRNPEELDPSLRLR